MTSLRAILFWCERWGNLFFLYQQFYVSPSLFDGLLGTTSLEAQGGGATTLGMDPAAVTQLPLALLDVEEAPQANAEQAEGLLSLACTTAAG